MSMATLEPEVLTPPAISTRRVVTTVLRIIIKTTCANGHVVVLTYQQTERRYI